MGKNSKINWEGNEMNQEMVSRDREYGVIVLLCKDYAQVKRMTLWAVLLGLEVKVTARMLTMCARQ